MLLTLRVAVSALLRHATELRRLSMRDKSSSAICHDDAWRAFASVDTPARCRHHEHTL